MRTKRQEAFDLAKHGWSFCNIPMLEAKIAQCEELAKELSAHDKRHGILQQMRKVLAHDKAQA